MKTRTTILNKSVEEVEEYDELNLKAKVDISESDIEILYVPKTIELQLWVDGMMVRSVPAKLGEATTVSLKVEHSWFVMKRYAVLIAVYPGGDPIVVKRKRWRKLGRLGWLGEYVSEEELEKSADTIILILSESNAYKSRGDVRRHGLGRGERSGADTAARAAT